MAEWSERLLCDGKAIAKDQCPGRCTVTRFASMPVQKPASRRLLSIGLRKVEILASKTDVYWVSYHSDIRHRRIRHLQ
jgi:hypothetical protein